MKENEQLRAEIELLKETVTNLRKEADNGSNLPRTPENIKYLKSIHGKEESTVEELFTLLGKRKRRRKGSSPQTLKRDAHQLEKLLDLFDFSKSDLDHLNSTINSNTLENIV